MISRLPLQTQQLATCAATGTDIADCGNKFATTEAEKAAFGTIEKLQGTARDKFKEAAGPIQKIINVVDGIAREDWEKVVTSGGKAVAVYVINRPSPRCSHPPRPISPDRSSILSSPIASIS